MTSSGRTILKNAGFLMMSQVLTWGMSLGLTIFMARALGPTGIGQLQLSDSLWGILAVVVTFGMDIVLTKEIARHPERAGQLVGTMLVLELLLYIAAFGLLTMFLSRVNYPADTVQVIYIIGISSLIAQLEGAFAAVLQGLERMEFMSLGAIAGKASYTILVAILLWLGFGVKAVASVSLFGPLSLITVEWISISRFHPIQLGFSWDLARWLLKASLPFFLSGIFLVMYMNLDVVFISLFANETVVGWYSAAQRLVGTMMFLPVIFEQALFPAVARLHAASSADLSQLIRRGLNWLMAIGVPLGLGIVIVARPAIDVLYGDKFRPSADVLSLMGLVLIFIYLNVLLGKFLVATDRQNWWTATMAVGVAITVVLDFVLIPWCQRALGNGALGGAMSYFVTEMAMTLVALRLLPKGLLVKADLWQAGRVLLAGGLMAAVVWLCRELPLAVQIAVGAAVYLPLAWVLRVIPQDELVILTSLAGKTARRVSSRILSRAG
jgi:O-antigen/teichoic acid export membrane protein